VQSESLCHQSVTLIEREIHGGRCPPYMKP
jgi:hypothetical protein